MPESSALASILFAIRDHGPISRADVSRRARLSQSVVSTLTRELIERGVVEETGTRRKERGRPSIMLQIRSQHAFFVGFSLTGGHALGVLTDLSGGVRARCELPAPDTEPRVVAALLKQLLERLLEAGEVQEYQCAGAGLALSGLIDSDNGTCTQSTVLGWHDVPIVPMLQRSLRMPVAIENDANAVALGERLFGAVHGHRNFAVLSVGMGIGTGIFIAGELHRGVHGLSGELGHCTVEPDGPVCRCGKQGCLEAIASVPVLLERASDQGLPVETLEELEALASSGEPRAEAVVNRAGHAIGLALSHLVNLFGPELVIVTGSGTRLGPSFQSAVRGAFEVNVLPMLPERPQLLFRNEDEAIWARGAAGLAAHDFLAAGAEVVATM